ncbi:inositol monophosphatase family protein [Sulfitobacter guttiformis]|uniref:Fructose-1,6-bisphosphatase/inositol monophosphatase family enzyme n=1 Tax=Sulfitobacter guttiformis TaxID=74349 RepID=A0A420DTE9_9RHOB|nr:inositol monophosphatase [Sulfitobacter guttiformis]KIN74874.1 Inositol monophosphatase [Sulfitobacter guttiformis KCTC 32187]RKE97443.1 fructose-1,6-bisphosphatase/inositol monophosphatase family enzyme [Sulfitobacter guttiformis]
MSDHDTESATTGNLPATLAPAITPAQRMQIVNIVRRAAKAEILPRFRRLSDGDIRTKSNAADLVTDADTKAEAMIARALQIAFPSALVIGEEAVAAKPELLDGIADAQLAFHIDPVDGTWNFAHGLALFGVIIAATRYGKPVFGLIYDPIGDDWAIADEEMLPELQRPFGSARPLKVAMGKPLEELSGIVPLHLFAAEKQPLLAATFPGFARVNTLRCSAHEYRMLAQGHIDFSLTALLHPWDHAAGALIAARAGAHVEMLDGGDYTATRLTGHLLIAPDKATWNKLKKVFSFLLEDKGTATDPEPK